MDMWIGSTIGAAGHLTAKENPDRRQGQENSFHHGERRHDRYYHVRCVVRCVAATKVMPAPIPH